MATPGDTPHAARSSHDYPQLLERLAAAQVASCQCMTKTPDTDAHALTCRYRILADAYSAIARLSGQPHPIEGSPRPRRR
jgi:hypothetical protein